MYNNTYYFFSLSSRRISYRTIEMPLCAERPTTYFERNLTKHVVQLLHSIQTIYKHNNHSQVLQ